MEKYRFTESADAKGNPIGKLEKQITDGGGQQSWVEDMEIHIRYDKAAEKDKEHDVAIADINSKIPVEASKDNQLTDLNSVNEKVSTASADFKGTFTSLTDLEAVTGIKKNDFGYVTSNDEYGNLLYNRYKYTEAGNWLYEYTLKQDDFTPEEWAAIQSRINAALVDKLNNLARVAETGNYSDLSNKPTINTLGGYSQDETGKLIMIMGVARMSGAASISVSANPEWLIVMTDGDNKILLGIKSDYTWEMFEDFDTIIDCVIDSYNNP